MDIADTQAYIWRLGVYFADNEQKQNKDKQEFRQQVSKTQWWWQRCSWQRKNKRAPGSDSRASSQGHGCSVRATAEPQSQQRSQGDTCLFGTGDLARDPGRGRNRPRGLPGGRTPPRMLLRVELCPLLSPNPYVDILTPQCLRIWSDLEIGLLQVQLVQMKSSWWRVEGGSLIPSDWCPHKVHHVKRQTGTGRMPCEDVSYTAQARTPPETRREAWADPSWAPSGRGRACWQLHPGVLFSKTSKQ